MRDLLSYLDVLHDEAGQPSLADMGRAVALAPSTLSGFFTGARLIGRGNLELLVEHLGGDVSRAESLRRKAVRAWPGPAPRKLQAEPLDPTGRLEIVIYESPVNKLNRPDRLLGRRSLIGEVNSLLNSFSRVLLHGLPGSGKTALAATLADQRVESGAGPYLWLRPGWPGSGADPAVVLDALASAFSVWNTALRPKTPSRLAPAPLTPPPDFRLAGDVAASAGLGGDVVASAARGAVAPRGAIHATAHAAAGDAGLPVGDAVLLAVQAAITRSGITLCVIDDAAEPVVLQALLRAMPDGLPVLVTSRRRLALDHQIELAGLGERDALQLLALHAHDNAVAVQAGSAALCADLGHHPYAIEIAGQHIRQYGSTPAELRAQLAMAPNELAVPGRESPRRMLDTTVSALDSPDALAVLRAFGAFPTPGATTELLAAYLGLERPRVELALKRLIDLSLTKRLPGSTFHAIHDLTFSYARGLGDPEPDRLVAAVRAFAAAHRDDNDLLGADLDNLIGAAGLGASSDVDSFLAIIEDLAAGQFLNAKGHPLPLLRLLDDAISMLRERDCPQRLHYLLSKRGNAHFNQGEAEIALDVYAQALACAPTEGRRVVLLSVIGKVLAELGRHDEAQVRFEQAYALSSASQNEHGRLRVLEQHSVAAFRQKDFRRVLDITAEGIGLARRLGDRTLEIYFLNNHGTAQFELGLCAAIEDHERAQRLAAAIGDEHALALTHRTLGADRHAQEDFAAAQSHFQEALALYTKLGATDRRVKLERLMRQFGYLLVSILLVAGCTASPATTSSPMPSAAQDDVAVVVIDNFSAQPVVAQDVPPTANCPYVPEDTNEVGDSGAGDGLPAGVAHGSIVQSRLSRELDSIAGLTRLDPTRDLVSYNLSGLEGVSSEVGRWRRGSHEITVIGLDTNGFTTATLAVRIQELVQRLKNGPRHIGRVVLNMSFVIVPCNVPRWLKEIGGFDGAAIRSAYWLLTGEHPELMNLRTELDRLASNPAEGDARLLTPLPHDPLLTLQTRLATGQFYGRTGGQGLPAPEVLQRLNNDPLKPVLAGLAGTGVVPVGAAGNGVVVYDVTRLIRMRFAFPFAPALWNAVVSVSAGQDATRRADYSNSGEIVMPGSTEVSLSDGTRVTVRGSSFAAPQIAARLGVYLGAGGPSPCDSHIPALGYADSDAPAPHWDDLTLAATASRYCRSYAAG